MLVRWQVGFTMVVCLLVGALFVVCWFVGSFVLCFCLSLRVSRLVDPFVERLTKLPLKILFGYPGL